ncbi:hypothetical protein BDD12DRAFT_891748 [Trichophaea hybrida]|nr:hypothetical protein BDD12DRAFT_891748 [Trichophaea hybrida]
MRLLILLLLPATILAYLLPSPSHKPTSHTFSPATVSTLPPQPHALFLAQGTNEARKNERLVQDIAELNCACPEKLHVVYNKERDSASAPQLKLEDMTPPSTSRACRAGLIIGLKIFGAVQMLKRIIFGYDVAVIHSSSTGIVEVRDRGRGRFFSRRRKRRHNSAQELES